jgi:hypothetical protein
MPEYARKFAKNYGKAILYCFNIDWKLSRKTLEENEEISQKK